MPCQGTTTNEKYLDVVYNRTLATYRAAFGEEPKAPQWMPPPTDKPPLTCVVVPATELAALRRDAEKWRDAERRRDSEDADEDEGEDEPSRSTPPLRLDPHFQNGGPHYISCSYLTYELAQSSDIRIHAVDAAEKARTMGL